MKRYGEELKICQIQMSLLDFLESYNKNMPRSFPLVSIQLLKEFKEVHSTLFKNSDLWSLEQHRKKVMDWLPQNISVS